MNCETGSNGWRIWKIHQITLYWNPGGQCHRSKVSWRSSAGLNPAWLSDSLSLFVHSLFCCKICSFFYLSLIFCQTTWQTVLPLINLYTQLLLRGLGFCFSRFCLVNNSSCTIGLWGLFKQYHGHTLSCLFWQRQNNKLYWSAQTKWSRGFFLLSKISSLGHWLHKYVVVRGSAPNGLSRWWHPLVCMQIWEWFTSKWTHWEHCCCSLKDSCVFLWLGEACPLQGPQALDPSTSPLITVSLAPINSMICVSVCVFVLECHV